MAPEFQTKLNKFYQIFHEILQKTLNFNCDFLKEGKIYLTFPVDFSKAQMIVFQ
jgi:hypothetical protein